MESKSKNDKIENAVSDAPVRKCPEYILKCQHAYYARKKEDPEFVKKERERIQKYRQANREHINEMERLRRRRKIDEKKQQDSILSNVDNEIQNLEKLKL